jgi:hypothetical protein
MLARILASIRTGPPGPGDWPTNLRQDICGRMLAWQTPAKNSSPRNFAGPSPRTTSGLSLSGPPTRWKPGSASTTYDDDEEAAEHWAFCNEFGGTGLHDVSRVAASLMSSPIWTFWWD